MELGNTADFYFVGYALFCTLRASVLSMDTNWINNTILFCTFDVAAFCLKRIQC